MLAMMPNRTMKERVYTEISNYDACFYKFKGVANNISDLLKLAEGNAVKDTFKSALDKIGRQFLFGDEKEGVEEIIMKSIAQKEHGEVFTPAFLVYEILDEFEKRYPDFFANPNHTVLDFAAGAGNLLKEVVNRFYNKTRHLYKSDDECMRHILTNQIYAVEIQANNYQMFCKNIDPKGLVPNNPHFICANALGFDYWDMMYNFDMTFINPPYRISTEKNRERANDEEIYPLFTKLAHNLSKRFVLNIIPSKFLYLNNDFTKYFFSLGNIKYMKTYHDGKLCFQDASVSGGILWYISDKKSYDNVISVSEVNYNQEVLTGSRDVTEFDVYPRSLNGVSVIRKILEKKTDFFNSVVLPQKVFGLRSNYTSTLTESEDTYKVLCADNRIEYILKSDVKKNTDIIDTYKYVIPKAASASLRANKDGKVKIIGGTSQIVDKNVLISETFLCVAYNNDRKYIENVEKFFSTKFVSYLMWNAMGTHNISKEKFCYVPIMDFNEEWSDEKLYDYFGLSKTEIEEIQFLM